MLFALTMILAAANTDVTFLRDFENPRDGEVLVRPYAMCFAADGALFLLDYGQSRIFAWDRDGRFERAFASRGDGPGQLVAPMNLTVSGERVWVWENLQRISIFDRRGVFEKSMPVVGYEPRVLAPLGGDLFLLGSRDVGIDGWVTMNFSLMHREGDITPKIKSFRNGGIVTPLNPRLDFTMKAFSPDIDIQRDERGRCYFGFSQEPVLYRIDDSGEVVETKRFRIPTGKASDEERQHVLDMSFPGPNGTRISAKSMPNLKISFEHEKAYYTHFLIKGNKIAFVLTPIGSGYLLGTGYARATYYVNDLATGEVLDRGAYHFSEDSVVFYRDGRILACLLDENDEYRIHEIALRGL